MSGDARHYAVRIEEQRAMNPLTHLIVASLAFLATHYVASTPLRDVLVSTIGKAYLALYSLVAFATLGWMIWAFYHAPFVNLWYAVALRPVPLVVMPFALVFDRVRAGDAESDAVGRNGCSNPPDRRAASCASPVIR